MAGYTRLRPGPRQHANSFEGLLKTLGVQRAALRALLASVYTAQHGSAESAAAMQPGTHAIVSTVGSQHSLSR